MESIRARYPRWRIGAGTHGYRAALPDGMLLEADTLNALVVKILFSPAQAIGPEAPPDELSAVKLKFPRYWIRRSPRRLRRRPTGHQLRGMTQPGVLFVSGLENDSNRADRRHQRGNRCR